MAAPTCLLPADVIAERVRALGREIDGWRGDGGVTLLGILKGAALFTADLARAAGGETELSFVHARSYGGGTVSGGEVRIGNLEAEVLAGRRVLVVDTILDTGRTLRKVVDAVGAAGAREIRSCVLLDKPARRVADCRADWVGFEVPDRFLVGYGLDFAGRYRALPYVGYLEGAPHA